MNPTRLYIRSENLLADTVTPVNIYLTLRDVFANSILLESSDYHGDENSLSLICCQPIATFMVRDNEITQERPGLGRGIQPIVSRTDVQHSLEEFLGSFHLDADQAGLPCSGLFGFTSYHAARYFEDVSIASAPAPLPDLCYHLYRYVIVVNHFSNRLTLFELTTDEQEPSGLDRVRQLIFSNRFSTYPFSVMGDEAASNTEEQFVDQVNEGIRHCQRGDVFQIVLSRQFKASFQGDEFNVYRALRSINPSPYLFFFDYGNFKLFGSSPEAQLQVKDQTALIYPIAGTFRRTGHDQQDAELANRLARDEKENAEHVMLVDLARNDLSRACEEVKVEVFREVQFYSHVIHLVSKVSGKLRNAQKSVSLMADTFPAGTLSGAPKHRAMQLINEIEQVPRGYYGGAIGFLGFNGNINQAIMIRTFMSAGNILTFQAGAGIVARSNAEMELQEVNNKLGALRQALMMAKNM